MENIETIYKTVTLSKVVATVAGTYSTSGELDTTFDYCDGIQFAEETDGDLANNYTISVRNQKNTIVDAVPPEAIVTGKADGSDVNKRFLDVNFQIKSGHKVVLEAVTGATLSTDGLKVKATFRCRRRLGAVSI